MWFDNVIAKIKKGAFFAPHSGDDVIGIKH